MTTYTALCTCLQHVWLHEDGCSLEPKHVAAVQLLGIKAACARQLHRKCTILKLVTCWYAPKDLSDTRVEVTPSLLADSRRSFADPQRTPNFLHTLSSGKNFVRESGKRSQYRHYPSSFTVWFSITKWGKRALLSNA